MRIHYIKKPVHVVQDKQWSWYKVSLRVRQGYSPSGWTAARVYKYLVRQKEKKSIDCMGWVSYCMHWAYSHQYSWSV